MGTRGVALVLVLVVAAALAPAGRLRAQTAAAADWQDTPASVLKGALRAAAAAQTRYRDQHGTYASDVGQLALPPQSGIRVDILVAGHNGWQGRATHQSRRGVSCVVFVGSLEGAEAPRTDGDREMAGEDGVPLCDRMR